MISVDIHNADLGPAREVTNIDEQVELFCQTIAHADQRDGAAVRSLARLAFVLAGNDAVAGAGLLLGAAGVAAHGIGVDIDEAMETLEDNMELCAEVEALQPRTS